MAEIYNWETTTGPLFNDDPSPNGWPEGMAPSAVNNTGREMMAVIARYREAAEACTRSMGSGGAYSITVLQQLSALADGMRFAFCANHTNPAGTVTLKINTLAAVELVGTRTTVDGSADTSMLAGEVLDGYTYLVTYRGGSFYLLNPSVTSTEGVLGAGRLPSSLSNVDADTVDGFHISTEATGSDANTLYFRS